MAVGVKHLIWDNEKDILHPEKARWLPNVPGTLENAAVRLVDARSGNRIYVRQYADKTKHMVVVDPAGKVEDQKPFRGGLVTQFPYAGEGHQDSMMIDWERVKGEGSLQGGPNPSRPASAVPGPRQEEFRHDDMTSDREVKERYGVEPLRNPADTDRRRLSNRENPTAHETGVAEAPGSRKRYSRRSGEEKYPGPPLSREALERYAMQLMGNARNKPELVVVEKVSDLPFEAPEDAKGALRRDVMYLVSEQISGAEDANEVVLHEFVGHFGLRGFFGSSLDGALHAIHENNPPVKQYAVEWRLSNKDFQGRTGMSDAGYYYRSIEEAMARMAQENKPFNSARRLLSTVRSLLRKIGLTRVADTLEAKSNTEALTMLHKAKLYIRKGMTAGSKIPEPLYPYFVAVRHGSPHKLDKFSTSRIGPGEGTQANGYGLHLAAGHAGLSAWNPEDVQRIFKGRPSWHTTSRLSASFGHAFNSRGDFDARGHACSR